MKKTIWCVVCVGLLWASPVAAQEPKELPREVALEIELQQVKEALVQTRADLARALNERLDLEARLLSLQLQASRAAVAKKAVEALGGNPACDAFNWEKQALVPGCVKEKK